MHRRNAAAARLPDVSSVCWSCMLKQQRHRRFASSRSSLSAPHDRVPPTRPQSTSNPTRLTIESFVRSQNSPPSRKWRRRVFVQRNNHNPRLVPHIGTFRKIRPTNPPLFRDVKTERAAPADGGTKGKGTVEAVSSYGDSEGTQPGLPHHGTMKTVLPMPGAKSHAMYLHLKQRTNLARHPISGLVRSRPAEDGAPPTQKYIARKEPPLPVHPYPSADRSPPMQYHFSDKSVAFDEKLPTDLVSREPSLDVDEKFDGLLEGFHRLVTMQNVPTQTSGRPEPESAFQASTPTAPERDDMAHLRTTGLHGTSRMSRMSSGNGGPAAVRQYHTSAKVCQEAHASTIDTPFNPFHAMPPPSTQQPHKLRMPAQPGIRDRLRGWQAINGRQNVNLEFETNTVPTSSAEVSDSVRLGDVDNFRNPEDENKEREELALSKQAEELDDGVTATHILRPGDLVEIPYMSTDREPVVAVFVRKIEQQSQCYTMHGKWVHRKVQGIHFSIPNFIDPAMLDDLLPWLPNEGVTEEMLDKAQLMDLSVPREVGAKVVTKLTEFWHAAEKVYRTNASVLDNAHAALAHPTDLRFGSLERIAMQLLRKKDPSEVDYYAVRRALIRGGWGFGYDARDHSRTKVFQIRSKDATEKVDAVREWVREYQEELALQVNTSDDDPGLPPREKREGAEIVEAFLEKSRVLIAESRKSREPTMYGSVGPSRIRFPITKASPKALRITHSLEFSKTDQTIIKFIELWSVSQSFRHQPRLWGIAPIILRALGVYPPEHGLGLKTGHMFLQEIGVVVPYENRVAHDEHLLLPTSQHSKPLERLSTSVKLTAADPNVTYVDAMHGLRHDWGNMDVYCVDDEGASEIDDGFSLERIPGSSSEYWVHIHIANPTAFIKRGDNMAKLAAHMTETVYFPEKTYPMLPRDLTQKRLSLANNRPTLTFSARVNEQGHVLDVRARNGFIRNVTSLTPQELSRSLGLSSTASTDTEITVGGAFPENLVRKRKPPTLSARQRRDLLILQELALARRQLRQEAGGLFINVQHPEVVVTENFTYPGLGWAHPSRQIARFVEGDPLIRMHASPFKSWFDAGDGSAEVTREMMLLCCEAGAQWCRQRGIPVVYRGTTKLPGELDPEIYKRQVLDPAVEANGGIPPLEVSRNYIRTIGMAMLATRPLAHGFVGVPQYSKVTSPLRRYGDMITHWQIEAALRQEAKTGKSLVGSERTDYLPFSRGEIDMVINRLEPRERLISQAKRNARTHWIAQLFLRAHHFGEANLPEAIHVVVYMKQRGADVAYCMSVEWSFDMKMLDPEVLGLGEARVGDTWEVRMAEVDAYGRWIYVRPTRLVRREVAGESEVREGLGSR